MSAAPEAYDSLQATLAALQRRAGQARAETIRDDPRATHRQLLLGALRAAQAEAQAGGEPCPARPPLEEWARAAEVSCYNAALAEVSRRQGELAWSNPLLVTAYAFRCGTLVTNLDPAGSVCRSYGGGLYRRLRRGQLDAWQLGELSAEALCPEAHAAAQQELKARTSVVVCERVTELYPCPRCRNTRCTYVGQQTRSLDEGDTFRCCCTQCGYSFVAH